MDDDNRLMFARNEHPLAFRFPRLEKDVLEYIFGVMRDLVSYEKVQKLQTQDHSNSIALEIERLEKVLASIPLRKRKLFELFETEDIAKEEFLARKDELAEMQERLRRDLDDKRHELQKLEATKVDREVFEKTIKNFEQKFKQAGFAQQKTDLAVVVERISIKNKGFKVNFRHSCRPD